MELGPPRFTDAQSDAFVASALASMLECHSRENRLRLLEAAATLIGDHELAERFRELREQR